MRRGLDQISIAETETWFARFCYGGPSIMYLSCVAYENQICLAWIGQDESGPYRLSTLSNHDQLLWGFISIHYYIYPRTFWTGYYDIPFDEGVHCSSVCAKIATCNNHSIYTVYIPFVQNTYTQRYDYVLQLLSKREYRIFLIMLEGLRGGGI